MNARREKSRSDLFLRSSGQGTYRLQGAWDHITCNGPQKIIVQWGKQQSWFGWGSGLHQQFPHLVHQREIVVFQKRSGYQGLVCVARELGTLDCHARHHLQQVLQSGGPILSSANSIRHINVGEYAGQFFIIIATPRTVLSKQQ